MFTCGRAIVLILVGEDMVVDGGAWGVFTTDEPAIGSDVVWIALGLPASVAYAWSPWRVITVLVVHEEEIGHRAAIICLCHLFPLRPCPLRRT